MNFIRLFWKGFLHSSRGLRVTIVCTFLTLSILAPPVFADEEPEIMILEPVVQKYKLDNIIYAVPMDGAIYVSPQQISESIGMYFHENGIKSGYWNTSDRKFTIDVEKRTATFDGKTIQIDALDFWEQDDQYYFRTDFYEKLFPISIDVDMREMRLIINSEETLPITQKMNARKKRSSGMREIQLDSFKDYKFDNRMWSEPVVDLSLIKGMSVSKYGKKDQNVVSSDSYSVNAAMLFAGMDLDVYMFGNSDANDRQPRTRVSAARTYLEEPPNSINLTQFQAGDLSGVHRGYFASSGVGRGFQASSFQDMVLSANKTIDITGPLLDGWEVELYLNDQLIGFRQRGEAGRYEFLDIPVNYGLNAFRLVFYGPYGEIKTEDRRYYSGTSPVAKGEFGYNFAAFQPNRYLLEAGEPSVYDESTPIIDTVGYYGLSNNATAIFGLTTTPDARNPSMSRQYALAGGQFVLSGISLQYNAEYGFTNQSAGHHLEAQGDVYVGNLLMRYENYGDLFSPVSYQRGRYLNDLLETRLSGVFPFVRIPWFISYSEVRDRDGARDSSASLRFSPRLFGCHFSIENTWYSNSWTSQEPVNEITVNVSKSFRKVYTNLYTIYQTHPEPYYSELGARLDWRMNKYTYAALDLTRAHRSAYSSRKDLDSLSIRAGRIFSFGGITLDSRIDSDRNASIMLRYNIGIGKNPERYSFIASPQGKLSERGAALVQAIDESDQPVTGLKVSASGSAVPAFTDENGEVVVADLPSYSKVMLFVDAETLPDVSLVPEVEKHKYVFRPGTIMPIKMRFNHLGAIEGQIQNGGSSLLGYTVQARNKYKDVTIETYTDFEGFFILDAVPFGEYDLVVLKGVNVVHSEEITLNDVIYSMTQPVSIPPSEEAPEKDLEDPPDMDDIEESEIIHEEIINFSADIEPEEEVDF